MVNLKHHLRKKIYILIICLIGIGVCAYDHLPSFNVRNKSHANCQLLRSALRDVAINKMIEIEADGYEFKKDMYLKEIDGTKVTIANIFTRSTLVLRVSEENCGTCIQAVLDLLKNEDNYSEINSLIVLCRFENIRNARAFKNSSNIDWPLYILNKTDIPADNCNSPYLFVIDENLMSSKFHIVIKDFEELTKNYLKSVEKTLN